MPEIQVPFVSDCIHRSSDKDVQRRALKEFSENVFRALFNYEGLERFDPRLLTTSIWRNNNGDMVYCTSWTRVESPRSLCMIETPTDKIRFHIDCRTSSDNRLFTIPMSLSSFGRGLVHFITFCNVEAEDVGEYPCESFKYIDLNKVKELCRELTLERCENHLPPQCFRVPGDT